MFGDSGMKEKILEKILELFSQLPDKEDEMVEENPEAKLEITSVDAKPMDKGIC